jgi:hypothetical protein
MRRVSLLVFFSVLLSCESRKQEIVVLPEAESAIDLSHIGKTKLSEYSFFVGELKTLTPAADVIPYTLNSALFSDYALKKRFVKIPQGKKAAYTADDVFDFPGGNNPD